MSIYLIRVNGFLHHGTSHHKDHTVYAAQLANAGHNVSTEVRS